MSTLRQQIETAIEALLGVLDTLDGDPDLEDDDPAEDNGDDEPSLGSGIGYTAGLDLELDTADLEPSLGWCELTAAHSQAMIATENTWDCDREADHDGREPEDGV